MARMQYTMWDEEGHETGAISEMATEAVWRRIPSNVIPPPDGSPPGTPPTYHPRPTYPRPNRTASDNPTTRDMHTEANDKRKDFLAARALLKAEFVKISGDDIAELMAVDQADGTIAGMSYVHCMELLERRYGTLSSRHAKALIAVLQTKCEGPQISQCTEPVSTEPSEDSTELNPALTMNALSHHNLLRYITGNMDFAQNFASTEGFIGLLLQTNNASPATALPTQSQPTKSAARQA